MNGIPVSPERKMENAPTWRPRNPVFWTPKTPEFLAIFDRRGLTGINKLLFIIIYYYLSILYTIITTPSTSFMGNTLTPFYLPS